MDRYLIEEPVSGRHSWRFGGEQDCDVERNCRDMADYLLELARQGDVEPAMDVLLSALDDGIQSLEGDARTRAEHVYESVLRNHIGLAEQRPEGNQVDPYYWG